jgi:uncharacterized membrane protein
MLYPTLLAVHVVCGIFWGGAAISAGFFLTPAVQAAGPAGGAVMAGLIQRKFSLWMMAAALLSLLSGGAMLTLQFLNNPGWLGSREGICLQLGGVLAILVFGEGMAVQKPQGDRIAAVAAAVKAQGGPPSAEQQAVILDAQGRMARAGRRGAILLLVTACLMGLHTLVR